MKIRMKAEKTRKQIELSLEDAFALYIARCETRGLAAKTVMDYKEKVEPYLEITRGLSLDEAITPERVDEYVAWLKNNRDLNGISINTHLRALRAFMYWCMDEYGVEDFRVQMTRADKKEKPTYSADDLEKLLRKPDLKKCSFSEYKVWAFENFLLGTGCRLRSALNVKISDIDFNGGYITLTTTKNRKAALLPLSPALRGVLSEYLRIRGGDGDDYVFCTDCGEQATEHGYQSLVRRYNRRRGVKLTSIHAFRHTFAKGWVVSGGDVFRLQKLLGHADLTTTREYVSLWGDDLKAGYADHSILDTMSEKHPDRIRVRRRKK